MALTLRRMERDGLVPRRPSQHDRRQIEIWLTDHAHALEPTLVACAQEANAAATDGISETDLATAQHVVAQLISNLTAPAELVEP